MTTKDQAIAWYLQTAKRTRVTQINMEAEDGWMALYPQPAPDCRACTQYAHDDDHPQCKLWNECTNGDQYQPAPKVVLWRTE